MPSVRPSALTFVAFVAAALTAGNARLAIAQHAAPTAATVPPRPAGAPKKTWERALTVAARPTPAGVRYQLNVSESVVEAADLPEFQSKLREANAAMVEGRKGRAPGSYEWALTTPWETEMNMGRCLFKNIDVRVGLDLDVVALGGAVAADSAAQAWWAAQLDAQWIDAVNRLRMMRDIGRMLYQDVKMLSNTSCAVITTQTNDKARATRLEIDQRLRALGGPVPPLRDPR